jgi:hypothetical protein
MTPVPSPARRALRNARREALLVMIVVVLALAWTLGYCALHGYQLESDNWLVRHGMARSRTPEEVAFYLGVPDWVLFGIATPWAVCAFFSCVLGWRGLADDDLGAEGKQDTV